MVLYYLLSLSIKVLNVRRGRCQDIILKTTSSNDLYNVCS